MLEYVLYDIWKERWLDAEYVYLVFSNGWK